MISFVGAGPGAADLITVRGRDRLAAADVVVWASSLVPDALLEHAREGAEVLDSAGMTLEDVLAVYERRPSQRVVRLHSGDPGVYGALQEQIDWCVGRDRAFEVVPGVSSVAAAAAALRRELTIPGVAQSVVLTRLAGRTAASMPEEESVRAFARHGATMALFLSAARPEALQEELLTGGYEPSTPAAVLVRVSRPDEQVIRTTVGELASALRASRARATVLVLVGDSLSAVGRRSNLYAPEFAHARRRRSPSGSSSGVPR